MIVCIAVCIYEEDEEEEAFMWKGVVADRGRGEEGDRREGGSEAVCDDGPTRLQILILMNEWRGWAKKSVSDKNIIF